MHNVEQLTRSLQQFFFHVPIPMIMLDKQGYILMLNEAYAEFLEVDPAASTGRKITEIIPSSRALEVLRTGIAETASVMHYVNGKKAVVHRIPLYEEGDLVGLFGMLLFRSMREMEELMIKNDTLERELEYYKRQVKQIYGAKYGLASIIGISPAIARTKEAARRLARYSANVLITGESGVGKELFAHAIHSESPRRNHPFVRINCAAIPDQLLEAELFGYEPGAFTGALSGGKEGKFEQTHRGTLFLDEIADMPLGMQAKILRVLQEGELERVGGRRLIPVDVRVIAATNRNLEEMVEQGAFRLDLYYRLNVLSLHVPPLRERPEDIPLLVQEFLVDIRAEMQTAIRFDERLMQLLIAYSWPGNVRQVRNVVVKIAAVADVEVVTPEALPPEIRHQLRADQPPRTKVPELAAPEASLTSHVKLSECALIEQALRLAGNNRSRAAEILRIPRSKLYRKLVEYGIPTQRSRTGRDKDVSQQ